MAMINAENAVFDEVIKLIDSRFNSDDEFHLEKIYEAWRNAISNKTLQKDFDSERYLKLHVLNCLHEKVYAENWYEHNYNLFDSDFGRWSFILPDEDRDKIPSLWTVMKGYCLDAFSFTREEMEIVKDEMEEDGFVFETPVEFYRFLQKEKLLMHAYPTPDSGFEDLSGYCREYLFDGYCDEEECHKSGLFHSDDDDSED